MGLFLSSTAILVTFVTAAAANPVEICLFEEEDWTAVITACTEALSASDDPVEQGRFVLHRGLAHDALGDLPSAWLVQVLAGQYRPDWFRGDLNASAMSEDMDDPEGALCYALAAIEAEPENPRASSGMLSILINGDDAESCAPYADQTISLPPHTVDWAFTIGMVDYLLSLAVSSPELLGEREQTYRTEVEELGIAVAGGPEGLMARPADCAAMGADCRLSFEDNELAQATG